MNLRQALAHNLAELMQDRPGLSTQMQVAHASGIAQTTISRILRATTNVTLDHLEQLATAFDVFPAELLMGHGRQPAAQPQARTLTPTEWSAVEKFVSQTLARRYGNAASFTAKIRNAKPKEPATSKGADVPGKRRQA